MNFLAGFAVPELNVGWPILSGILRANEFSLLVPTTPLRLLGIFWRLPNLTSDLGVAGIAFTIFGKGVEILVVVGGVVVGFVGGGPQIRSESK